MSTLGDMDPDNIRIKGSKMSLQDLVKASNQGDKSADKKLTDIQKGNIKLGIGDKGHTWTTASDIVSNYSKSNLKIEDGKFVQGSGPNSKLESAGAKGHVTLELKGDAKNLFKAKVEDHSSGAGAFTQSQVQYGANKGRGNMYDVPLR